MSENFFIRHKSPLERGGRQAGVCDRWERI